MHCVCVCVSSPPGTPHQSPFIGVNQDPRLRAAESLYALGQLCIWLAVSDLVPTEGASDIYFLTERAGRARYYVTAGIVNATCTMPGWRHPLQGGVGYLMSEASLRVSTRSLARSYSPLSHAPLPTARLCPSLICLVWVSNPGCLDFRRAHCRLG